MPSWYVDWAAPDGSIGGFVRIGVHERGAWCWLYVVGGDGTVVVRDHDVPRPRDGVILARSDALWCELVCEVPDDHWAVNAEAFGVRLDDPTDAWRGEIGHRIAVGLELDWEAFAPVVPLDAAATHQLGRVTGEILLGDDVIHFAGAGAREHDVAASPSDVVAAMTTIVDETFALHARSGRAGYLWRDGAVVEGVMFGSGWDRGGRPGLGLLDPAHFANRDISLTDSPLHQAAIPLGDDRDADGVAVERVAYGLTRTTFADGRVGHGWRRQPHLPGR